MTCSTEPSSSCSSSSSSSMSSSSSASSQVLVIADDASKQVQDEEDDIEKYEIYRLDYEIAATDNDDDDDDDANNNYDHDDQVARAAGGEILQPGDHVYMECTLYQHHGIVLQIMNHHHHHNNNNSNGEQKCTILIAEFTNVALANDNDNANFWQSSSTASAAATSTTTGVTGGLRLVHETHGTKWYKVKYQASLLEHWTWRPGTCSTATPLPVPDILWRVQFLWQRRHDDTVVPRYHLWTSNCETVAVWCRTGQWTTLQASRAMTLTSWSTITTAAAAAAVGLGPVALVLAGPTNGRNLSENGTTTQSRISMVCSWKTACQICIFRTPGGNNIIELIY